MCLGTMTMGRMSDESTAYDILDKYVALGGDFLDTAEMYPVPVSPEYSGESESIIGRWLASRPGMREKLVIATKVAGPNGPGDDAGVCMSRERTLGGSVDSARGLKCDLSREQVFRACDASLKRLGISTIDLYQIHWPERYVPKFGGSQYFLEREAEAGNDASALMGFDAVVTTMGELIAAGKIREWGVSNETSFGVCSLVEACVRLGVKKPSTRTFTVADSYSIAFMQSWLWWCCCACASRFPHEPWRDTASHRAAPLRSHHPERLWPPLPHL